MGSKVIKAYGAIKEKLMYGRKVMGTARTTYIIDEEGKIQETFPDVKVAGHVKEVLDRLK